MISSLNPQSPFKSLERPSVAVGFLKATKRPAPIAKPLQQRSAINDSVFNQHFQHRSDEQRLPDRHVQHRLRLVRDFYVHFTLQPVGRVMGKASLSTDSSAKNVGADIRTTKGSSPHQNSVIMLQAHSLWPLKTAAAVSEITGYAIRTVKDWDAGNARIPADALVSLLQSEWGREFLAAVMANNEPRWWVKLKAFFNAIDIATMQRITRRKLREALDAQEAARQGFTPSTAALFQDEEFFGGQPIPPRTLARPVVGKRGR